MKHMITTTYLEMLSIDVFKPKKAPRPDLEIKQVQVPIPVLNHFFFVNVGRPWKWYSRLAWRFEDWQRWVENKRVTTWLGYLQGSPIGYCELELQQTNVEISFFGLLPQFLNLGLGGWFLSEAVKSAWQFHPQRVWVHTCSFDHPCAVTNYEKRGFSIYKEETRSEEIPDDNDTIWLTPRFYASLTKQYAHLLNDTDKI